ncbi:MAG: prolipoprotein diacylglyceryl transferase [bacterium]|nr:prolipoprotein diacylglyceryl transferase [bacterium]
MFKTFYTTFNLGPIPIQFWGFFVALGMVLSFLIVWHRSKKLGLNGEKNIDIGVWVIVAGIIWARLFHVFFYEPIFFLNNLGDIIKIWQGGMSSFGGLFGAVFAIFILLKRKKIRKKDLVELADLFSFSTLYGWILGRVGCVMIHDHLGKITESIFSVQTIDGLRYEMAFLEIIWLIPLAVIFYISRNRKMFRGYYLISLFIYYGILRFILDFYRATDIVHADARYFGLTPGQYFGMVLVIVGVYLSRKVRIVA